MAHKSLFLAMLLLASLSTAEESQNKAFEFKPAAVDYAIYGGGLGDPVAPQKSDTKIAFEVKGKLAKSMFDAMGPDVKDVCTEGSGTRVRKKDHENLSCMLTKKGEYFCSFGFDLRTGKSIGGIIC